MTNLYLDASAIRSWSSCREEFRNTYVLNRVDHKPNIHYQLGIAVHLAVERFWKGDKFETAMDAAYEITNSYPVRFLNPKETETWKRLVDGLPDCIAYYYDAVEYDPSQLLSVEKEWTLPYEFNTVAVRDDSGSNNSQLHPASGTSENDSFQVILCGRMDRVMVGPRLVDVKTASEISNDGKPWKQAYREEKLLDFQFGLYDYYLRQTGKVPIECYLEVLIKPYRGKAGRYERLDLPEVISDGYRRRFDQQLAWKVSEIVRYHREYAQQNPWPMAGGLACSSKYGRCQYHDLCVYGEISKVTSRLVPRIEHLDCRREK